MLLGRLSVASLKSHTQTAYLLEQAGGNACRVHRVISPHILLGYARVKTTALIKLSAVDYIHNCTHLFTCS